MRKLRSALKINVAMALCCAFALSGLVLGQSGRLRDQAPKRKPVTDTDDLDVVKLRIEEILLPVNVRGSNGKLPARLDKKDFIIAEDGKRQEITSVHRSPANVLFIIDASSDLSVTKDIHKDVNINRNIALNVIKGLADDDQAAVITYADKVDLLSDWTKDKTAVGNQLNARFKQGIKSDFYNAIFYAATEVLPKVEERRSVVLITDGVDSFDNLLFEEALTALHQARATIYVVSQNGGLIREIKDKTGGVFAFYEKLDPSVRKRYDAMNAYAKQLEAAAFTMQTLAEETGGAMWNIEERLTCEDRKPQFYEKADVKKKAETCVSVALHVIEELSTEFVIAYTSERKSDDKSFHSVKVFGTSPDVKIRTRRGIYPNLEDEPVVRKQ
ncbi:MAG: VWA domain-containing protein [Acidobacteriota bacterium]